MSSLDHALRNFLAAVQKTNDLNQALSVAEKLSCELFSCVWTAIGGSDTEYDQVFDAYRDRIDHGILIAAHDVAALRAEIRATTARLLPRN